ncbi:hypothetical protein [Flavobacterium psychrotolerans]|uniref:Uncharacterized protein n=1 Tax=Flavobacterium psychrotolerans TaxID=2169410 RepID=A0A2U1JGN4_9FLAO|nr:hypothetical protein [Flavobacterium psychrotolerans]PWA04310.1 hypothetical protein DB895_11875 [Flavobacterium psychrotolerans]
MLNKGLRDEESIRIDNVLKTLLSLVFVPKTEIQETESTIETQLEKLGLTIETLLNFSQKDLLEHLLSCHLDWNHLEEFADFLIQFSKNSDNGQIDLSQKAVAIYEYIQQESKTFSFEINIKIAAVKASLL